MAQISFFRGFSFEENTPGILHVSTKSSDLVVLELNVNFMALSLYTTIQKFVLLCSFFFFTLMLDI